jgi:hypothetical protein
MPDPDHNIFNLFLTLPMCAFSNARPAERIYVERFDTRLLRPRDDFSLDFGAWRCWILIWNINKTQSFHRPHMMSCFFSLNYFILCPLSSVGHDICPLIFIALFFPFSLFLQLRIWAIIHMTGLAGDLRGPRVSHLSVL